MGRHHNRKQGMATSRRGRRQSQYASQGNINTFTPSIGLIGLLGAGALGYTLIHSHTISGFTFGIRKLNPFKKTEPLPVATSDRFGLAPTSVEYYQ